MRNITLTEGEYYHLYNRGVDKRIIFSSALEYKRFLAYLLLLNDVENVRQTYTFQIGSFEAKPRKSGQLVAIGAFCLMPNHFHLYATPLVEDGISKFMQRVQTAYTMFFNKRHERSGALFQGTFKARHVSNDTYAKYLFSYIHLNPAKLKDPAWKSLGARNLRGLRAYLREYPYSSFREYSERRHLITDPKRFPEYFSDTRELDDHIDVWLETKEQMRGLASKNV